MLEMLVSRAQLSPGRLHVQSTGQKPQSHCCPQQRQAFNKLARGLTERDKVSGGNESCRPGQLGGLDNYEATAKAVKQNNLKIHIKFILLISLSILSSQIA